MFKKSRRVLSGALAVLLVFSMCLGNLVLPAATLVNASQKTVRAIDVWDFSGVLETNTDVYVNHMNASFWNDQKCVDDSGKFTAVGESLNLTVDDLILTYVANDRLYNNFEECNKSYSSTAYPKSEVTFEDGYTSNGIYYCNGTGSEEKRCFKIENVKAGDRVSIYAATSNNMSGKIYFKNVDGGQLDTGSISGTPSRVDFVAEKDGSYKIFTDGSSGKGMYYRVTRTPAVNFTGKLDLQGIDLSGYTLKFVNNATGQETTAELDGENFSALLAAGYTYTAVLGGVSGYGISNSCKTVETTVEQVVTGSTGNVLTVQTKQLASFTGKITGFKAGYDVSRLAIKLAADLDSNAEDVELSIKEDLSFSASLEAETNYTLEMSGVNDYLIASETKVSVTADTTFDIEVAEKQVYKASGSFLGLPEGKEVSSISFVEVTDSYRYAGTVKDAGYEVSLREGSYRVEAVVDGYTTNTHVVIRGGAVNKNLLFVQAGTTPDAKPLISDIYVGYSDKENNFKTVKEAVKACKAMNPQSESDRITVHIAPGTYREQIILDTPYLTFVNDEPSKEVKLTWYYGIGYQYYSADETGYYNEENAFDQYEKRTVSKWGVSTYVRSTATGFKAENITFEASFNRYVTEEEIEDGVEVSGTGNTKYDRTTYGADVASKAATERAAAMCIEADQVEFNNCSFLGSQDTLYTGGSAVKSYFKNCLIEGNTDYIFGDGDVVFDGCELKWYGYTSGSMCGYITAARPNSVQNGYLFRNCTISENEASGVTVTPGYFGRPWGADAKAAFLNTKLLQSDSIVSEGWASMDGRKPENANYVEYATTAVDGSTVDTSVRVAGVTEDVSSIQVKNYFGTWTPSYYTEDKGSAEFVTDPYLSDNGDINAPYPGHTLTACYSLGENDVNDASIIRWYRVDTSGNETLIKSSTKTISSVYKLTKQDTGNHIKVTILPETVNGNKGKVKSYTMEAMVLDGYDNPGSAAGDVELGDGTNIFLSGDSTVKDYSISGMYMNGLSTDLGSWGEFLQSYFDKDAVNVVNYANGGRSCRSFLNEGSLDAISNNIGDGDYLFIQFGHNDCANGAGYLEERFVPLGEPDKDGIYPVTAGVKVTTPSSLADKYGSEFYSYDCGGTYKWYLKQYIDAAKAKGAIPVLVTPVSRMYYNNDGTIRPHHDSTDGTTATQVTSNNAYVAAVKQLAKEENVLCIDAFDKTKALFEEAYQADKSAAAGVSAYGSLLMASGDKTHCSKLGGFIEAGVMAQEMKALSLDVASYLKKPANVMGKTSTGTTVFNVSKNAQLTAYETAEDGTYTNNISSYWTEYGQKLLDASVAEEKPEVSEAPVVSETPVTSEAPSVSETPVVSQTPAPSESSVPTVKPSPTTSAVPSVEPSPSESTVPSVKPSPSESTVPSVKPSPTVSAVPSVKPTVKPSTKPAAPVIKTNLPAGKNGSVVGYTYNIGRKAAILKVNATGKNITYQWYYNTKNSYQGAVKIKGAVKASYTPSTGKTGSRYYFCKISSNDSSKDIKTVSVNSRKVKVTIKRPVTKITAKKTNVSMKAGKTTKLSITVLPSTATNKNVTFKSSNTKYATVSAKGVVTAKKAGIGKTVTITVTSKDNKKAVKKIKVKITK